MVATGERQSTRDRRPREHGLPRHRRQPTAFALLVLSIIFGGAVPARADNVIRFVGRVVEATDTLDTAPRRDGTRNTLATPPGRAEIARWLGNIRAHRPELGVRFEPVDRQRAILRVDYP